MDVYSAPQIADLYPLILAANRRRAFWRRARWIALHLAAIVALLSTGIVWPGCDESKPGSLAWAVEQHRSAVLDYRRVQP